MLWRKEICTMYMSINFKDEKKERWHYLPACQIVQFTWLKNFTHCEILWVSIFPQVAQVDGRWMFLSNHQFHSQFLGQSVWILSTSYSATHWDRLSRTILSRRQLLDKLTMMKFETEVSKHSAMFQLNFKNHMKW